VFFTAPRRALSLHAFTQQALRSGLALSLKTQMLYDRDMIFINGEGVPIDSAGNSARRVRARLRELADARWLQPSQADPAELLAQLYAWYRAGYLGPDGIPQSS
jgi:50S ribosomal protein L16 3-hydroxylase